MSEPTSLDGVSDAVVEPRRRPSIVWLIPLVALAVGAFVAWRALSERGPSIAITFESAEGLEAGKTEIRYKDVAVGVVESVELEKDLSGVVCHARMVDGAKRYLTDKTRFWVVKPRVAGGQVSGLGTLLSGSYIGVDPVFEGERTRRFAGLEVAPLVTTDEPGRQFVLRSDRAGAVEVGSPVFFRGIPVGRVVSSELDAEGDGITTRIFVEAPYDARVHAGSRFWNASGIDASIGADGVRIDTQSVISILVGGIAFDTPPAARGERAEADAVFPLFESRTAAETRQYTKRVPYRLEFDQSVRGLAVGSPVEFRGIPVGEVTNVTLAFDREARRMYIPVEIELEPERFVHFQFEEAERREALERMVARGLRAQLKTGNLLTGQLVVALDFHPNAPPAQVDWSGEVAELPTIPTPIEEITANVTQLVQRLGKVPIDDIGRNLDGSLAALRTTLAELKGVAPALEATLEQTRRTVASVGPDSSVNAELRRTLLELSDAARALGLAADQIQSQPSSLIFGKDGDE
ncbi:MAG: paraquat-inducible protein B [Proteobacteria bacterium]|nr:MAG: paraquat-inducible protein B [Pseudomonadota bacterium]